MGLFHFYQVKKHNVVEYIFSCTGFWILILFRLAHCHDVISDLINLLMLLLWGLFFLPLQCTLWNVKKSSLPLRCCPESCDQQAQAVWAPCVRGRLYVGDHRQQGPVLVWHRAADAQWHRPSGRGRHQTAPPVCQAEAQVPGEEEYHHHLWHRQSKDELTNQISATLYRCIVLLNLF